MGNKNLKNWNENDIRLYLSEEFPDAGQEIINKVTQGLMTEGRDRITNALATYRQTRNFERVTTFRNVERDLVPQVAAMIEGVHRRFVGGTYEPSLTQQQATS